MKFGYKKFGNALSYKMGFAVINACYSNGGKSHLISNSPSSIWAGHSTLLDPTGTNFWGDANIHYVQEILQPGMQGTK